MKVRSCSRGIRKTAARDWQTLFVPSKQTYLGSDQFILFMNSNYNQLQEEQEAGQEIEIPVNKQQANVSQDKSQQPQGQQKPKHGHHRKSKEQEQDSSSDDEEKEEAEEAQRQLIQKKEKQNKSKKPGSAKSIQLQQMELEAANKRALQWAIRLRSCSRIIFLIIITSLLITGFYLIFQFYAFFEGVKKLPKNSNLFLNISNCRLNIYDSVFNPNKTVYTNIKNLNGGFAVLNQHDGLVNATARSKPAKPVSIPDLSISYTVPGRFNIDPNGETSQVEHSVNGSDYIFSFDNIFSAQSCEIDLEVYATTQLNNLVINCFQTCYIMIGAKNISFNNFNISGDLVEVNAPILVSKNFSFEAIQGRFQGGYLDFEQFADIRLESGDIVVQTDKEMMVNFTHSNPHYCFGSPVVANPIVVGCQPPPDSEVQAFLKGVGTGKKGKKKKGKKGEEEKGKKEGNETAKDEGKGEKEGEDDLLYDLEANPEDFEDVERFFDDKDSGTVIFLPFADTYNQSKEFQKELGFLQNLAETAATDAGSASGAAKPSDGNGTATNTTKKPAMHSKTKEKKAEQTLLFQPSCFGNTIFCRTANCTSIRQALAANNQTISVANSTGGTNQSAPANSSGIHGRFLYKRRHSASAEGEKAAEGGADAAGAVADPTAEGEANKTAKGAEGKNETKIDYKGLQDEAYKKLPHEIPKGVRFLNVTGRFGNVYVNLIRKQRMIVNQKDTIIHGSSYASGDVDFDLPSQKILKHYMELAADPHNFDPNFVLEIGSKKTKSDNFQQWQVTFNPAYSYIRPWWIGTFSFTLMSTASWDLNLNLGPGFCPYIPNINLDDIFSTNYLVKRYFNAAEHGITTLAWQNSIQFPNEDHLNISDGVRATVDSNDEFEQWVSIIKLNETNYQLDNINMDQSVATQWAVYVSIIISIMMAGFMIVGVVYMVNSVYKQIIEQVTSTSKYGDIEKKNDAGNEQPLMKKPPETHQDKQKDDKKKKGAESDEKSKGKEQKKGGDFEIVLNFNPGRLFYQLFVLAPPLSAFIDYLCVLLSKKYINSADEFYTHLFEQKEKTSGENELHDLSTESILGNEMKTLYEKFCFLSGFLEQKLDDPVNLKLLKAKGFKIEKKEDAQTESYVRVLLNRMMPRLSEIPVDKVPLALFIEKCCRLSNFEEDNVVVATFNEAFQEFCTLNHLEFEAPSAAMLQKDYHIESKYIPQQWVERDEEVVQKQENAEKSMQQKVQDCVNSCVAKCLPEKSTYAINRQKMQNHYSLIMNHPEKIKTQAELALANRELILFGGWYIVDFVTVMAHFVTTIVLILPLFCFTILEKILYSQYSLIPAEYLITLEDVKLNYWLLPIKLYNESSWIKNILILVAIYWIYSIIDLIYYYISMEFPQENFFKKVQPRTANKIQLIFRQIMWGLVLYSAFQLCVFITLALVWLLLGAIVNPTAFLPYATAAATFVTVVSAKAAQFQEIASEGFTTVIEYVENIAKAQIGSLLTKMDLKGKLLSVTDSDAFKGIASQAASLGLVDQSTLQQLEANADQMLSNPEKAQETAAGELAEIAANPGAFVAKMMKKLEEKAIALIKEQMVKQVEGYGEQLANISLALFKKDKNTFKNNMTQLIYAAAKANNMGSLLKLGQPVMNLVWEFAYPDDSNKKQTPDEYIQKMLGPCTDCIAGLVAQELQSVFSNTSEQFDPKVLSTILKKAISLEKNLQNSDIGKVFTDLEEIIYQLKDNPQFTQFSYLSRYAGLLKIAMSLFEERSVGGDLSFHRIYKIISSFFDEIPQLQKLKDLLGFVDLLVNSFKKQSKALPTKFIRQKISKGISVISQFAQEKKVHLNKQERLILDVSFITQLFNFMQHNFDKIPKEQIRDIFKYSFDNVTSENRAIADMVKSEKEYKKLVNLMQGVFEMVGLFMEETTELTEHIHKAAAAFAIPQDKAQIIQTVLSLKYLKSMTYEGSEAEDKLFLHFQANQLIVNCANKLRVDPRLIRGILGFLMSLPNRPGVTEMFVTLSHITKVDRNRVVQFFNILILFKSNNESHLANAAAQLCIPREYLILILVSKKVLEPQFIDEETLISLGAQKGTLDMLGNPDLDYKQFLQALREDVTKDDDKLVEGGNSQLMKKLLLETISNPSLQITQEVVVQILLALGNNQNEFAKLSQSEIELLKNILQLKNIDLISSPTTLSSDTKQGVYTFAQIMNINKNFFEDLINICFLINADRIVQSIQNTQPENQPFIENDRKKDYLDFIEFMLSKMDLIQKKHLFLVERFSQLLPMVRLPKALIMKLLFNKEQSMDINSFYQIAYLIIGRDAEGKLPKGTLRQLNKSISFLTSTMNSHDVGGLRKALNKDDLTDGQGVIIQMLNENSKKRAITLFLNFLQANSKKNKNDDQRSLPQIYHLFTCLYLYFTGQASEILINYEDPVTKQVSQIPIVTYISKRLDIKQEFFDSLHTFYLKNNKTFTWIMVKFMRRYQACKFEAENPGIKIPLQSLVKIPDQFVLNFINLMTGEGYQTSFFAKELGINADLVDLISTFMKIMTAHDAKERFVEYGYLTGKTSRMAGMLTGVQVIGEELVVLLRVLFQDFNSQNLQQIIDGLKLNQKLDITKLGALLAVDSVVDNKLKQAEYMKQLELQLKGNQLLENMKIESYEIVMLAKAVCRGGIGSLKKMIKFLPHLDYPECDGKEDYFGMIQGFVGCISGAIPSQINITKFLRDLFKELSGNDLAGSQQRFPEGSNNIEIAYMQIARTLNINPMILMLSQGVMQAWDMLLNNYEVIQNEENKFLHPALVLKCILTFQAMPTLIKELLTEVEMYQQFNELVTDTQEHKEMQKEDGYHFAYFEDTLSPFVDELKALLFADEIDTAQEFIDVAVAVGFNTAVIDYFDYKDEDIRGAQLAILASSVEIYSALFNVQYQSDMQQLAQIINQENASREPPSYITYEEAVDIFRSDALEREKLKKLKPLITYVGMIKVYQETTKLFVDPRYSNREAIKPLTQLWAASRVAYDEIPVYTLGVCTTLTQLRNAYFNIPQNMQPRDDDHYKIVAHQIDYILTSTERLFFFKDSMDYFSKPRAAILLGLASGFVLKAEDFISANSTRSLLSYKQACDYKALNSAISNATPQNLEREQFNKFSQKFQYMAQVLSDREVKRDQKYFKNYNLNALRRFKADIYTEPENYLLKPIQIPQPNPDDYGFNMEDYIYDIGQVTNAMLKPLARFQGNYRDTHNLEAFMTEQFNIFMKDQIKKLVEDEKKEQLELGKQASQMGAKSQADIPQQHQMNQQGEGIIVRDGKFEEFQDVRSGVQWTEALSSIKKWQQIADESQEFKLLIDIFKGNYGALAEPDTYFTDEEPQNALIYSGLIALSGAYYKVKQGWTLNSSNDLSKYLNTSCWNTQSNKKNLQEIISVFFNCFEGLNVLAQSLGQDPNIVNSLLKLSCNLSKNDDDMGENLKLLIGAMNLSQSDTTVLYNLIQAYSGDMSQYYSLATYSGFITKKESTKFKPVSMGTLITNKRGQKPAQQPDAKAQSQDQATQPELKNQDGQAPGDKQEALPGPNQVGNMDPKAESEGGQKDNKKDDKKDDKKDGKKENKKHGKAGKKRVKAQEDNKSGDIYSCHSKILKTLLFGFDQSQLHSIPSVNSSIFNFSDFSALSLDPDKTAEQFIILLWQLAQATTIDTLPDECKLPVLSESEIQSSTLVASEYRSKVPFIKDCCDFISQIAKDDYSFFYCDPKRTQSVLCKIGLLRQDSAKEDLNFLKAMIGLKSNKMQVIQQKVARDRLNNKMADISGLAIAAQVENLVKSKIISIQIDSKEESVNKQISEDIAQLFLAISSGNINKIVESFINRDGMSACFVLTLYLWKNLTILVSRPQLLKTDKAQKSVFPAIQLLPILIFSNIHESQDRVKGAPRIDRREFIQQSIFKIIKKIGEQKPEEEFYQDIEKFQMKTRSSKKQFQWSLWLITMKDFLDGFHKFGRQNDQLDFCLETEYLIKVMTGYYFYEKVQNVPFIGHLFQLYVQCSKLINYPQYFAVSDGSGSIISLKNMIPSLMAHLDKFFPPEYQQFLSVFDKFIQLFVFIQIPKQSMSTIKKIQKTQQEKKAQQLMAQQERENQQYENDEYENEGEENQENQDDAQDDRKTEKDLDKNAEGKLGSELGEIEKIITDFVLDVLNQTIKSLFQSFKEEKRKEIQSSIMKLEAEIAEASKQQAQQNLALRSSFLPGHQMVGISPFGLQSGQFPGGILGAQQNPAVPMGQSLLIQPGLAQSSIGQPPLAQPIGAAPLIAQQQGGIPPPPPLPAAPTQQDKMLELKRKKEEIRKFDEQQLSVQKLIYGIIALLTGYNIQDKNARVNKEQKIVIMCYIVDQTMFKNLKLEKYINTKIIRDLYKDISVITSSQIKSITDKEFLKNVLALLYTVTGQEPTDEIKDRKKNAPKNAQKSKKGDPWYVALPKREKIVDLPMNIIQAIFKLASFEIDGVTQLLKELKVSEGVIKLVEGVIQQVVDLGVFGGAKPITGGPASNPKKDKEIQELMKKISEGQATPEDMFKAIDADGSNSISKEEYGILARRLGMNLSEHRINEIFASIKKGGAAAQGKDGELNQKEFAKAMGYLQNKNTDMALDFLGISPALLTVSLILLAIILLLIFVFIFLGIQAFALGGTFGAVINSILPMAAGGGAGGKADKLGDKGKKDTSIGDSVEKTQKIIQSDEI